ncbi:hypothetical protein NKJ50_25575 [Mesorhizobium sp. M0115]
MRRPEEPLLVVSSFECSPLSHEAAAFYEHRPWYLIELVGDLRKAAEMIG